MAGKTTFIVTTAVGWLGQVILLGVTLTAAWWIFTAAVLPELAPMRRDCGLGTGFVWSIFVPGLIGLALFVMVPAGLVQACVRPWAPEIEAWVRRHRARLWAPWTLVGADALLLLAVKVVAEVLRAG